MSLVSINPATGVLIQRHREYTSADIERALTAAHDAFLTWRHASFSERARHLVALAATLRKQKTALARLITSEMGKPRSDAQAEVEKCAVCCEFYAQHAAAFLKPRRPSGAPKNAEVAFEPLGVALAIMPWNFPFWQLFRAAAPTLMAGNTLVLKHASNTSGCALAIERVFEAARAPSGLLRTLLVSSKSIPAIVKDPRVRGVTLTGSTAAGRKVGALAGGALKPVVLELGGSDPYVILADADLDLAAEVCATARLTNAGQSCVAGKRFIVVEEVRAAFEQKFTARMAARRPGDPTAKTTDIGPLARADLRDELHAQVQKSLKRGARALLGGVLPSDSQGFFYPATVLTDVRPGMPAYDEELFGPVAAIIPAKDETDALRIANDTAYGLGAALFSRNRRRARELARKHLDAGLVFINAQVRSHAALPFGGVKDSGVGRELGSFGIHEFVNTKTLWVE